MQENKDCYQLARDFALNSNRILFITGKAGSGKTTFLKGLKEVSPKQMIIVAPTGVAAINVGGITLHSLFHLPFTPYIPTESYKKQLIDSLRMHREHRSRLYNLEVLVIDEISMVRADVLDAVDTVLREVRYRPYTPFGGVQMIFVGDMHQLSPVITYEERNILSKYYAGPYFFQSRVMQQISPIYIEFDKIFRQEDNHFIEILNEVRTNTLTQKHLDELNSRFLADIPDSAKNEYITLCTHRAKADTINKDAFKEIKGETYEYVARITGDFSEKMYPAEQKLKLKVGTRVMFTKNDERADKKYYNGKIGVICKLSKNEVVVNSEGEKIIVEPTTWENIQYVADPQTETINEEVIGTFKQLPLQYAWAITIHKSQGLTFQNVIIDAEKAFTPGQVYVALSRCRTLDGIVLLSRIRNNSLYTDNAIIEFSNKKSNIDKLSTSLEDAEFEYELQIYSNAFRFYELNKRALKLQSYIKDNILLNHDPISTFVDKLAEITTEIHNIGKKFINEIFSFKVTDHERLCTRLKDAAKYFKPILNNLLEEVENHPIVSEFGEESEMLDEQLNSIYGIIFMQLKYITGFAKKTSIQQYYHIKTTTSAPILEKKCYKEFEDFDLNNEDENYYDDTI